MASSWNVARLLGVSSSYWQGCTLQAAVRLDIFSQIGQDHKDTEEMSGLLHSHPEATELLLNALSGMGLLVKEGVQYRNSDFANRYLSRQSTEYMGNIILHHHHLVDGWAQLDRAVITGNSVKKRSYGEETERQSFIMGMFNLAMGLAPSIAKLLDLDGRSHLLDLGGGPGTYAIHFCLANPGLQATIFDRPTTRPFANDTVKTFNLQNRIDFIGGDFTSDEISGGPYDVAWLSHILHSNSPEQCQDILTKTVTQTSPGALILVHDFILEENKDYPEFAALFSLNMLINNGVGRSYSIAEITKMMQDAGINDIQHIRFDSPNDSSILLGTV